MRKKVYFSDIVFTDKYLIDGIDVLDESNLTFIGYKDIDLGINQSFSKIDNAKIYIINELNIQIGIAEVRDFKIICFMKPKTLMKIANHPLNQDSIKINYKMLEEYVVNKLKNIHEDNIVYSDDYKTRAVIENKFGSISLIYQTLDVEDLENFFFYEEINSNNFWSWYNVNNSVSYFDSIENATKEAKAYLANVSLHIGRFNYEPVNILWEYNMNRINSWLYQMKFALIGLSIFLIPLTIFPILGLSNWKIMYLISGCGLFSIIVSGITLWKNANIISYGITDKGIYSMKGIYFECKYENIKSIKIKKNPLNKNKSIKFKLYKGSSINYNFDNIDNAKEAYDILNRKIMNNRNKE